MICVTFESTIKVYTFVYFKLGSLVRKSIYNSNTQLKIIVRISGRRAMLQNFSIQMINYLSSLLIGIKGFYNSKTQLTAIGRISVRRALPKLAEREAVLCCVLQDKVASIYPLFDSIDNIQTLLCSTLLSIHNSAECKKKCILLSKLE